MAPDDPGPTEPGTPGWDAIHEALRPIYGSQEPHHWGTLIGYRLGGPDPLDGISAYARAEPVSHWHYVTFGLTELYEKEWTDAGVSGFGFELTFRLHRRADESAPPVWVCSFLQNLARYVFQSGNVFDVGHHLDTNGPIALEVTTNIRAIAFAQDPELASRETSNGRLAFLQLVGVTLDELDAMRAWNAEAFLEVLRRDNPLLVTDLDRNSVLLNPATAEAVREGVLRDGSSTSVLYVGHCGWSQRKRFLREKTVVTFGANAIRELQVLLPGRLPFGRSLTVASESCAVTFTAGAAPGWRAVDRGVEITLPGDSAKRLAAALEPRAGVVPFDEIPGVEFEIVKSEIKDAKGNVVQVVG